MSFLADILGVEYATEKIEFEKEVVVGGQTKFIDAYIADTKVLIEQKSYGKDLNKAIAQSGGLMMTPYEQAKNYANNLPFDEIPRWIITCNFGEFHIYDMNSPGKEPDVVQLDNLQAGDIVGELYDELLKQYKDPTNDNSLKSLNVLCVRLVFCLYAEDAGIFGRHGMFHDYLMRFSVRDLRKALIELFIVLDTKIEDRDPYMDEELAAFPYQKMKDKIIYDNQQEKIVQNINPYLINADNIFIETRKKPLCDVPSMIKGSSPVDGGNLFISEDESKTIQEQNPNLKKYIKKFYGAREYLHNLNRDYLWLEGIKPAEVKSSSLLLEKIQAVKDFRLASTKIATQKYAEYPMRFMEMRQPDNDYILVPRHSSENRRYIPFGFMSKDIICGDANNMIPSATLYHFGIIISNVHMAWTRAVCGRIKSDYRYSNDIVYNNFPWPDISEKAKDMIEKTAQGLLDARKIYLESSLADLYDPLTMPIELRKGHQANDRAVMKAYGFNVKEMSEADCVAELMKLYQKRVNEINK